MPKGYEVTWSQSALLLQVKGLAIAEIDKLALEIIVESDPPIETGFLDASAYVNSSSGLNTFDERWADGKFVSRHSGKMVPRASVSEPEPPPRVGAVAAWAADYAIWVEERTGFIFQAVQTVAGRK